VNKLEEAWRSYAEQVLPGHASEAQRQSMKMAYFAGASRGTGLLASGQMTGREISEALQEHVRQCMDGEL
jgi:hypothetical protein